MTTAVAVNEIRVHVADYAVAGGATVLFTLGLGSCVAIALHDAAAGVGALAHVLLPTPALARETDNPARFPCTVVPLLVREMRLHGAGDALTARLVGGASMFRSLLASGGVNVGERNAHAAHAALRAAGVPVVGEDTGGEHGRSVYLDVRSGALRVRSLRAGDREL